MASSHGYMSPPPPRRVHCVQGPYCELSVGDGVRIMSRTEAVNMICTIDKAHYCRSEAQSLMDKLYSSDNGWGMDGWVGMVCDIESIIQRAGKVILRLRGMPGEFDARVLVPVEEFVVQEVIDTHMADVMCRDNNSLQGVLEEIESSHGVAFGSNAHSEGIAIGTDPKLTLNKSLNMDSSCSHPERRGTQNYYRDDNGWKKDDEKPTKTQWIASCSLFAIAIGIAIIATLGPQDMFAPPDSDPFVRKLDYLIAQETVVIEILSIEEAYDFAGQCRKQRILNVVTATTETPAGDVQFKANFCDSFMPGALVVINGENFINEKEQYIRSRDISGPTEEVIDDPIEPIKISPYSNVLPQ